MPYNTKSYGSAFGSNHKHRCPSCYFIWEHNDSCAHLSQELWAESHTCPKCGKQEVTKKYFGFKKPAIAQHCDYDGMTVNGLPLLTPIVSRKPHYSRY